MTEAQDPAATQMSAKARLLRLVDQTARGVSPEVRQVIASYGESFQRVWVAGSYGSFAADVRSRVTISVTVMAARDGLMQTGRETLAHQGDFELPGEEAVGALAAAAAEKALAMLDSRPAPGRSDAGGSRERFRRGAFP